VINWTDREDEDDLVDDICLIIDKSSKRALSTLSLVTSCCLLNFITDDILGTEIYALLKSIFIKFCAKAKNYGLGESQESRQENQFLIKHLNRVC
jgi:hypothetical protein